MASQKQLSTLWEHSRSKGFAFPADNTYYHTY